MKKRQTIHGVAALVAALSGMSAYAQTPVTVYGLIDTAVEHVTNVTPTGESMTRMPNLSGGFMPSRIGFRGEEKIGGGLKAIFTLENGFGPDAGTLNQGNRLFGRQAWVGLSGDWGAVTVGRTYSMLFYSFFDVDLIGPAQHSTGTFDAYLPNSRMDNSIAYKGTFSGVTVGASYSLGRDASSAGGPAATNCGGESAADDRACRSWSALLRYDTKTWGVVAGYDTYNGGSGAFAPFSPTSSSQSDSRLNVGAYAKFRTARIGGGVLHRDNEAGAAKPKSRLWYLSASYDVSPTIIVDALASRYDVRNSGDDARLYIVRGSYYLSRRTALYASIAHIGNDGASAMPLSGGGTAPKGAAQNGIMTGIRHSF